MGLVWGEFRSLLAFSQTKLKRLWLDRVQSCGSVALISGSDTFCGAVEDCADCAWAAGMAVSQQKEDPTRVGKVSNARRKRRFMTHSPAKKLTTTQKQPNQTCGALEHL
jgi:hypothetical protein